MEIFEYTDTETDYLARQDKILGDAIVRIGHLERPVTPDLFGALANSIVSQQISTRAAETVWGRLVTLVGEVTPETIAEHSAEALRGCGMSLRKAGYLHGAAAAVVEDGLSLPELSRLPDEEIIKRMTALPGVGVWTVEMLMIFSMCRPDVVSYNDLAIRRGMMRLYGLSELTRPEFDEYRQRWSPYGSVASLYLWAIAHRTDW